VAAEPPKQDAVADAKSPPAEKPAKKSGRGAIIGIFGGVMVVEAVLVFGAMKLFGSDPDPTVGMEVGLAPTTAPWEESREIEVAKVRVLNSSGGRSLLYSVRVVARVHEDEFDKVKQFLESRKSTVEDAICRVIRSAEERQLAEPGLETLKRQVRYELGNLMSDEQLIEQILIPECMPLATAF